jgi:endonuclease YncB( thermonuclease family)
MTRLSGRRLHAAVSIIALFSLLLIPGELPACQFKVTRVYDGGTIKAEGCDIEIMVRLVGTDAPDTSNKKNEPGQPFCQSSKKNLSGLMLNKMVEVKGYGGLGYAQSAVVGAYLAR